MIVKIVKKRRQNIVDTLEFDLEYLPRVGDHLIIPVMGYIQVKEIVFDYTSVEKPEISIVAY